MNDETSPVSLERENYLAQKRADALICNEGLFIRAAELNMRMIPLLHACAFRYIENGETVEGILIDYDQYKTAWSEDYTDLIPYELEHEAVELWHTRGKKDVDPFGPDHYLAVHAAMKKAFQDGKMERYIAFRREVAKLWSVLGDDHAKAEVGFYLEVAEELRKAAES